MLTMSRLGRHDRLTPTLALVALITLAATAGCASNSEADGALEAKAVSASDKDADGTTTVDAIPVEVSVLRTGPIQELLRASANLEAERAVQVFSKRTGIVEERLVEEGDRVREGQIVFRLEDDEARNAVMKAEAELLKARREFERQKTLHAEKLISDQEFNNATFEIERLEIVLADAKLQLGFTEIRAPISGTVAARLVDRGQLVNPSQHVMDIVDFDSIVARIYVPEQEIRRLSVGLPARVAAQALGGTIYDASVLRIAPTIDARSGTVKVTVAVGAQPGLRPGLFVDVDLVTATRDEALLLPKRALVFDSDRAFAYRVGPDLKVSRVPVLPVLSDRDHVVPQSGFASGDQVVVAGQAGLKDGALVSLPGTTPATTTANARPGAAS